MRTLLSWSLALLLVLPGVVSAQKADRSAPPKLGPPPLLRLKDIQHLKLSNGIPVVLYEKHDVPLVQVDLLVRSGSVNDPEGKKGLASLVAAVMMDGAGTRDALAFADAVDYLGAEFNIRAGAHVFTISLDVPVARLDSALGLMADATLRPRFPVEELARTRRERLTTLLQWRDEPRMLASILVGKTLFPNHPYGIPALGTESDLRSITVEDLKAFHAARFGSNLATLVVVGDVTPKTILPRLEAVFGKLKPVKAENPAPPSVAPVATRRVLLVDKPNAPQSEVRFACLGAARSTPDYFPMVVANTLLGGSFTSRLNQNLRETHGYTYGASSYFDFRPWQGPFIAGAAVQTQVTDSALLEFLHELKGIRGDLPQKELDRVRNYIALGYPGDFQTIGQIAGKLVDLVVFNLPDTYFNEYVTKILSVSKSDAERAAQTYIDPERMVVIVVGDRATIEPKIAALNLGPLTVLSVEDVLGKAPVLGTDK